MSVYTIESDDETNTETNSKDDGSQLKSKPLHVVELEVNTPPANPFVEIQISPEQNNTTVVNNEQGPAFEESDFEDISVVDLDDMAQQMEKEKRRKQLMRTRVNIHIIRAMAWGVTVVDILFGVVGFTLAIRERSPILIAFTQLFAVDLFCCVVTIWRYWHGASWEEQNFMLGANRDKRCSVVFSMLFGVLGITVFIQSLLHLIGRAAYEMIPGLIALTLTTTIVMTIIGITRLLIGIDLGSVSVKKHSLTAIGVAILSLSTLVTTAMIGATHALWWLDGAIGILISLIFFFHGLKSLVINRHWIKDDFKFKRCIDTQENPQP